MKSPRKRVTSDPTLAVIGCGAIAATFHLPALIANREMRDRLVLVDPDTDRASDLATEFNLSRVAADYRDILDDIDGAIITTPHHLHFPIALDCIDTGIHVLCEKPLAETSSEVKRLADHAESAGVVLAVNNTQRLYASTQKVRDLIHSGALGTVRSIAMYWGEVFDWPTATGFRFVAGGKGVLFDVGVHAVDLLCWWLGGKPHLVDYCDDSLGGNEAVVKLTFELGECAGELQLSWLSRYENAYSVRGDAATVEGSITDWRSLVLIPKSGRQKRLRLASPVQTLDQFAHVLIENFFAAIRGDTTPLVSGKDVAPSIEFIEECYSRRRRFETPWHDTAERIMHRST